MAKAKDTLANGYAAIKVLAKLAARSAVKDELRSQGLRLSRLKASDIERLATEYLADHPELHFAAFETRLQNRSDRPRRPRPLTGDAGVHSLLLPGR